MTANTPDADPADSRAALSRELEGLEGLVYRISTTLQAGQVHTASLAVVCEAIYLARQVMSTNRVEPRAVDDLLDSIRELERRGMEWRVNAVMGEVWPNLPADLQPADGPARSAMEFALRNWLSGADLDSKDARQLAAGFAEFCVTEEAPAAHARRRARG